MLYVLHGVTLYSYCYYKLVYCPHGDRDIIASTQLTLATIKYVHVTPLRFRAQRRRNTYSGTTITG